MSLSDVLGVVASRLEPEDYLRLLSASLGGCGGCGGSTGGCGKVIAATALEELNAWADSAAAALANKVKLGFLAAEVILATPTLKKDTAVKDGLRALEDALNDDAALNDGDGAWRVLHPTRSISPWHPLAELNPPDGQHGLYLRCERMWLPGSSRGTVIIQTAGPEMAGIGLNAVGNSAGGWSVTVFDYKKRQPNAARILIGRMSEILREMYPNITIYCL